MAKTKARKRVSSKIRNTSNTKESKVRTEKAYIIGAILVVVGILALLLKSVLSAAYFLLVVGILVIIVAYLFRMIKKK